MVGTVSPSPLVSPRPESFGFPLFTHGSRRGPHSFRRFAAQSLGKSRTSHCGQNAVYISVLKILSHRDRRAAQLSWIADSVAGAMSAYWTGVFIEIAS